MKVAIVSNDYPTEASPHVGQFVRITAQAIGQIHDVTVIHLRGEAAGAEESRYQDGAVEVRGFPNALRTPEDYERAAQIVYSIAPGFQIMHTMNLWSLIPFGLPERQDEQLACPWVHTEPWQLTSPQGWPSEILPVEEILLNPDGLTAPSVKMLEDIAERRYGKYTAAVPYIVLKPEAFVERPREKGKLRLVSVGAVTSRHQPEIAIRTVKTLRAAGVDATLTWVGEGTAKIRSQEKVKELGLGEWVEFVSSAEAGGVDAALAAADLFIGPTKSENFYLSLAQALLAGRPAVVGEGAKDLEYINEDTAKVVTVVTEKNSKFWAEACQQLQAKTLGLSAAEVSATIGDRYSPAAIAEEYDEVYRETLAVSGWEVD